MLKRYSNEINSSRFIYSRSDLFISFTFDLNREDLARTVQDLNRTRQKEKRNNE